MDVPASQFKARCLELISLVKDKRVEVIITKRGQRVAKLVPLADEPPRTLLGYLRGTVTVVGDITEPVGEVWDADPDGK
jgi:prevent-host-death family protein